MANKNKVEFGTKECHVGLYTVDPVTGEATLEAPQKLPGMRALTLEAEREEYKFYADDVVYYSEYNDNGMTGELNMALFPDEFKLSFLNYATTTDGGVAQVKGMQGKQVYIAFQGAGDKHNRRHLILNVSLGAITREHKTIEESREVEEESIPFTAVGDNKSGRLQVSYNVGDTGYETVFTAPTVPVIGDVPVGE